MSALLSAFFLQLIEMKNREAEKKVICSAHSLLSDLKTCSIKRDLQWGKRLHEQAISSQNDSHIYVGTALMKMYAKCSRMAEARCVFEKINKPDVVSWNILLLGYAENGDGFTALELFSRMKASGYSPNPVSYVAAVKACTSMAVNGSGCVNQDYLKLGKKIHSEIGLNLDHYVQSSLTDMYAKCKSMDDARRVFDNIQKPDVVSWNALLLGYAENKEEKIALDLFSRMKAEGCVPDSITYVAALKACTSLAVNGDASCKGDILELGRGIHSEINFHLNHHLQHTLVEMYSKCNSMVDARRVFDSIRKPDVVTWSAVLLGYAENEEGHVTLELFSRMKARGCTPDAVTYMAALKACISLAVSNGDKRECLEYGRAIHKEIDTQSNHFLQSTLLDMYTKCGSMADARLVFDSIVKPDVVSWTTLLLGYVEIGESHMVLDMFSTMKSHGCIPNSVTYVAAIKACGLMGALIIGRKFHAEIREFSFHVVTSLVDFYAKCGSMAEAREVFDLNPSLRVVPTWNALMAGYGSFGDSESVFDLFRAMQDEGFRPSAVTFLCMLLCCSHAGLVEKAREYFDEMPVRFGVNPTIMHYACMVDVLGRANRLNEALAVLRNMSFIPDAVIWTTLLGACRKWKNVEIGRLAFQFLVCMGKQDASSHVLMAQIYGSRGMFEEQQRLLETSIGLRSF